MPELHNPLAGRLRTLSKLSSSFSAISAITACAAATKWMHRSRASLAVGLVLVMTVGCGAGYGEPATMRPVMVDSVGEPFADFVAEASQRFGIPAAWIRAVMRAESFGDARANSPKGAMGLMQIMPKTWAGLRQRYGLGADPYDAHDNIIAGAAYLRELHDRYGIPGFLAAYSAGPARWEDHLATGRPLPAETRTYLARLAPIVGGRADDDTTMLAAVVKSWTEALLFPGRPTSQPDDNSSAVAAQPSRPSVNRPAQDLTGLAPQSNGLFVALSTRERRR